MEAVRGSLRVHGCTHTVRGRMACKAMLPATASHLAAASGRVCDWEGTDARGVRGASTGSCVEGEGRREQ